MNPAELIDNLVDDTPDFLEAYMTGRKWVADQFYGGDMTRLVPLSTKIAMKLEEAKRS